MIFNPTLSKSILASTLFLTLGCSDFLKGRPKEELNIEIKKESLSCLKTVSLDFKKFLKSESTDAEIEKTFSCFDNTLKEFQTRAEGATDKDAFTSDELFQIFEKFLNESQVSKEATADLLALKSALLGGTGQKITKAEIAGLREYLLVLRTEIKNLLPYAQLIMFKKNEVVFSKSMIRNGFAQLNLSLKNLMKASRISQSNYQFNDLKNLAHNLNLITDDQKDLLILAEKVNGLLVGNEQIATEAERHLYIDNLTEVLRLYSMQVQGYVKFQISSPEVLSGAFEYVHDMLELLENTIQFRKSKMISAESIDPLLVEILKKDVLPVKLSKETALGFYKTLLVRVFDSGLDGDTNAFDGIKKVHLVNLKRELATYRLFNKFVEKVSGLAFIKSPAAGRLSLKDIQNQLKQFNPKAENLLTELDLATQEQVLAAFEEIRTEFLAQDPVIYRFNKVVLAANQEMWNQNWEDLSRGLYHAMLSRELLNGWGRTSQNKELKTIAVNEQGLIQWYSEFRKFGIEIKSFDPRSKNSGASNLLSANLFTRDGNGDQKLNFREATQFLSILFSGGGQISKEMYESLKKSNCNLPELDVFDFNWNNEACVIDNLRANFKNYFSNLPYMSRYLDQISKNEEEFKQFYDTLIAVARIDATNKGRIETADLRALSILLHYVESLFAAFDKDRNGLLSEAEIKSTYPRFKSFAEQFARKSAGAQIEKFNYWRNSILGMNSCFTEQDLIRDSFVFMVYNGKSPAQSDLTSFPCLRNEPLIKFNGEVDRKQIINTLKIIKAVLGS